MTSINPKKIFYNWSLIFSRSTFFRARICREFRIFFLAIKLSKVQAGTLLIIIFEKMKPLSLYSILNFQCLNSKLCLGGCLGWHPTHSKI